MPRNALTHLDADGRPVVAMAVRPIPETPPTPAAPPPPTPKLTGGGELGFAAASGNSNNESFNGRLDLTYTDGGAWRHSGSLFGLHSRSEYMRTQEDGSAVRDTRTTANRYTVTANSAYLMDDRGTLNTSVRHEKDDFGTYSPAESLADTTAACDASMAFSFDASSRCSSKSA